MIALFLTACIVTPSGLECSEAIIGLSTTIQECQQEKTLYMERVHVELDKVRAAVVELRCEPPNARDV